MAATAVSTNATQAYLFFLGKGLSPAQSAGIVGNLLQESGVNPTEPGGLLAQWTGSRYNDLVSYAQSSGQPLDALGTQLNFIWQELNTTQAPALAGLKQSSTPAAAALAFSNLYERPEGTATNATATTPNSNPVANIARRQAAAAAIQTAGNRVLSTFHASPAVIGGEAGKIAQIAATVALGGFAAADLFGAGAATFGGAGAAGAEGVAEEGAAEEGAEEGADESGSSSGSPAGTLERLIAAGGAGASIIIIWEWFKTYWLRIVEFFAGVGLIILSLHLFLRAGMRDLSSEAA